VKGDAQRSFAIEIQLITQGEEIDGLTELLQSIEGLCFGWMSFRVQWSVVKEQLMLPQAKE
jgi:hypothetical protein